MTTKLRLSMDDLTLGEMELFEEATGKDMMEVLKPKPVIDEATGRPKKDPNDPKGRPLMEAQVTSRAFIGLVFIAMRRDNPALTIAEVKAIPLNEIDFDLEATEVPEADPTEAADGPQSSDESEYAA